jgi:hypothetical protein
MSRRRQRPDGRHLDDKPYFVGNVLNEESNRGNGFKGLLIIMLLDFIGNVLVFRTAWNEAVVAFLQSMHWAQPAKDVMLGALSLDKLSPT